MHPALVWFTTRQYYASINVSLKEVGEWGQAKARDLTKKVSPWLGLLIIAKSWGGDFWISSDYGCHFGLGAVTDLVTSQLIAALPGRLVTKDNGRDLWVLFIHMYKMAVEENMTWYLFFSSLFLFKIMNTSIWPWVRAFDPKIALSSNPWPLTGLPPRSSTVTLIGASY